MGLFDKKFCSVCGEKIKFLGNRKLEDGNLCKDCAKKLSHWFDERRHSTVDQIKEQLAYREQNRIALEGFEATRVLGDDFYHVYLDEPNERLVVATSDDFAKENPDIIAFSQVKKCDIEIDETKSEEKRETEDGRMVSYNPPHYTWRYRFRVTLFVEHPYFDDIRFDMNRSSVVIDSQDTQYMFGGNRSPRQHPEYLKYAEMCDELRDTIAGKKKAEEAAAPKTVVVCSYCGATTTPDANGCCEYCGAPVAN